MPTVRLGSDPNGVVRNASQGFGGAARQAIVNAGGKLTNLNAGGSLDLSRRRIQSPKRARRAVSEVRTVPANPFENTGNSALCKGVSVVRKGDDGGETGRHSGVASPAALIQNYHKKQIETCNLSFRPASTHCILSHPVMILMMGEMIWGPWRAKSSQRTWAAGCEAVEAHRCEGECHVRRWGRCRALPTDHS